MKISEALKALEQLQAEHGDLDLIGRSEDGWYEPEFRVATVIDGDYQENEDALGAEMVARDAKHPEGAKVVFV